MRSWLKHHLPYPLTCAIARLINQPMLAQEQRSERLTEYTWVLNRMKPGKTLDMGYAGSYFAEALCQFGPVIGCDPKRFPISHSDFSYEWPLASRGFNNIVCVSVLEHYLDYDAIVTDLIGRLNPGGQILLTFPTGHPKKFRGYQNLYPNTPRWNINVEWTLFSRTEHGWLPNHNPFIFPENTEHQVNALACIRLTHPAPSQQQA